jgi:hypothetical protein
MNNEQLDEIFSELEQNNIILIEKHKQFHWYDHELEFRFGPYPTALGALLGAQAYIRGKSKESMRIE